jgi:hypothetical protein
MYIEVPDPHPGRCRNYRYSHPGWERCLDYDNRPHTCRFPEPTSATTGTSSYTLTWSTSTSPPKPWVMPGDEPDV